MSVNWKTFKACFV